MVKYPVRFLHAGFMPFSVHSFAPQARRVGILLIIKDKSLRTDLEFPQRNQRNWLRYRRCRNCQAWSRARTKILRGYPRWSRRDPVISAVVEGCDQLS